MQRKPGYAEAGVPTNLCLDPVAGYRSAMIAAAILAQLAAAGAACAAPQTQAEMNSCAAQEYEATDAELNAQWEGTATAMRQRDMMHPATDGRPGYFDQLLAAQRAWLDFRDAHCVMQSYLARGGSLEPMLVANCRAALTRARTEQLHELQIWPE